MTKAMRQALDDPATMHGVPKRGRWKLCLWRLFAGLSFPIGFRANRCYRRDDVPQDVIGSHFQQPLSLIRSQGKIANAAKGLSDQPGSIASSSQIKAASEKVNQH
ncbi:hypothetical protein [Accumulibacter sp.]|uniref:hypothetical protein n=1 Tax=Accumulibacter sp. TaxID=2053492 RepID=UPI002D009AE4|nr:hypothetical protein [Accumulibacter sp.]HRF05258.1 hypothetical protein [Accumulibacter sp.]